MFFILIKEAEKMFAKLSKGGAVMNRGANKLVKMSNDIAIGYRPVSVSGPPTIDIKIPGQNTVKLKYLE